MTFFQWLDSILYALVYGEKPMHPDDPQPPREEPPPQENPVPSTPVTSSRVTIEDWCLELKNMEGWFPGSSSYERNNPGNLRCPPLNSLAFLCQSGFCVFRSETDGMRGLINVTRAQAEGRSEAYSHYARLQGLRDSSELNIQQYFAFRDPPQDHNDPNALAERFATKFNIPLTFQLKDLL